MYKYFPIFPDVFRTLLERHINSDMFQSKMILDGVIIFLIVLFILNFVMKIAYEFGKFSEFINNVKENMREMKTEMKELRKEFERTNRDILFIKVKLS